LLTLTARKNGQHDTECKKTCRTAERFLEHGTVYEPGIGHTGADESRQKKNELFHYTSKGGGGNYHTVSH